MRFKHYLLANNLFCAVDLTSKYLATLRQRASIDPIDLGPRNTLASDSQLIPCLNPIFKILSSNADHFKDPPTLEDCFIIFGQITYFHLSLIQSTGAFKAYDSKPQSIIPDYNTSNFNFLSSRSVQFLLQAIDFSLGQSTMFSGYFLETTGGTQTAFEKRPLDCLLDYVCILSLPCQRLTIELTDLILFI